MNAALPTLYLRNGTAAIANDEKKGKPAHTRQRTCWRCGGVGGSDKWAHTGWTCYDCGGSGVRGTETLPLYTAEKLAKLNVAAEAKAAKKRAAAEAKAQADAAAVQARRDDFMNVHGALIVEAEAYTERSEFLRDVLAKARAAAMLTDAQAAAVRKTVDAFKAGDAKRAGSGYVGTVGQRIEFDATVERVSEYERKVYNAPWLSETVYIVTFRDPAGNALVAMSPRLRDFKKDEQTKVRATVKEHSVYKDEKQTKIERVKVL